MKFVSILSTGLLIYSDKPYFYKFDDGLDTPFHQFPKINKKILDNVFSNEYIVLNKKKYFKYFDKNNDYKNNWKDLNTLLWVNNEEPINLPDNDYLSEHIDVIRESKEILKNYNLTYSKQNDIILKACTLLDGYISIGGKKKYKKDFDHFTKSGRIRDKGGTVSIKKEEKEKVDFKDGYLYIDMKNFHLKIIDNVLEINMLPEDDILNYISNRSLLPRESLKKEIFRSIYSERFDIDHPFFEKIKQKYKKLRAILKPTKEFNYKIQQWESYIMSQFIINNQHLKPVFYLYDGIIFDAKPDIQINDVGYPYTIKTKTTNP